MGVAEVPAGLDESSGVDGGVGIDVDRLWGDALGCVAGGFGGFAGVFRQVGRDLGVCDVAFGADVDGAYVDLFAPGDRPPVRVVGGVGW